MFLHFFSGLRIVGVDFAGEGILNIDTFTVGTNDNVFVVLNATCCVRKALLSMIDVAGNANRAEFNKGPLKGTSDTRSSEHDPFCSLNRVWIKSKKFNISIILKYNF